MRRFTLASSASLLLSACGLLLDTSPPDPDGGVVVECTTAAQCDDGLFCTGFEDCILGTCQTVGRPQCGDEIACTDDVCNEDLDACEHEPVGSRCASAQVCDPNSGCRARVSCVLDDECDDHNPCTTGERCGADMFCVFGRVKACPSTGCLRGVCDPSDGECDTVKNPAACVDDASCTKGICHDDGFCEQETQDSLCNDSFSCTRDVCLGIRVGNDVTGCVHHLDDDVCKDSKDTCYENVCAPHAAAAGSSSGCAMRVPPDACGQDESCNFTTGVCQKLPPAAGSSAMCADGDPCNGTESLSMDGTKCVTTGGCPEPADSCFESVCVNGIVRGCGFRLNPDNFEACLGHTTPTGP